MQVSRSTIVRGSTLGSRRARLLSVAALAALMPVSAYAADGTWNQTTAGNWNTTDTTPWLNGIIAMGDGATANFTNVDAPTYFTSTTTPNPDPTMPPIVTVTLTPVPVNVTEPITIGNLNFAETDPSTPGRYEFSGSAITLSNGASSPVINVGNVQTNFFNPLVGTNGFTKTGAGTLFLSATSTLTGTVFLNEGEVSYAAALPATANALGTATLNFNGGTLTQFGATGTSGTTTAAILNAIVIPTGQVGNINLSRRGAIGSVLTGGGTLNLRVNFVRSDMTGNFNGFTGQVNLLSNPSDGVNDDFRLLNANGFQRLHLGAGVSMYQQYNPPSGTGTQTVQNIGELSGDATSYLGGNPINGRFVNWTIGNLNTISTFNGVIGNNANPGTGAARLTKVGTGKLFLGGANTYTGATQVNGGTLGIVGAGNLNGSVSVNFATGTTFDVSGATPNAYSTGPGQTLTMLGTANIVGNYLHDEGIINPGGIGTASTLNFANNFDVSGGNLNFDLSPTLTAGGTNDLYNVAGTSALSGNATLNINTIGTFSQGTYTIIQTAGGITGSAAGWTVAFGSRGAAPTLSLSPDNTALLLTIAPVVGSSANLKWKGPVGPAGTLSLWDIATTANWNNLATNTDDRFFQFDNVSFSDTYTNDGQLTFVNNPAITLNSLVQPGTMVFDANFTDYSINGTGSIGGTGGLTKSGGSLLTLGTVNTFNGPVTISGGRINATVGGALGSGPITISNNAILDLFANATVSPITVTGAGTIRGGAGGGSSGIGAISGTGTLTFQQTLGVFDLRGDMTNFNGDFNLENAIAAGTGGVLRFNGFFGGQNTVFNLGDGGIGIQKRNGTAVLALGGLNGGPSSYLSGSTGGASATNYQIGARNTDSLFDGTVNNGPGQTTGGVTTTGAVTITKVGTGTLTLNGANTYTGASVVQAGTLVLGPAAQQPVFGGAAVATPAGADIQGGKIAFSYAGGDSVALNAAVGTALDAGFDVAFASGTIRSTTLAAGRILGWIDNTLLSQVEVAYTLPGDSNLDFAVNFDDLLALAQAYDASVNATPTKVYAQGDSNYDGFVNFDDLLVLAQNYNLSLSVEQSSLLGSSFAADYALALSQVPEPTSLAVVGGLSTLLLGRRRRA